MLKICIKRPITLMIISIKMLLSLIIAYFIDFRVFFSKFRNTVDISYIDNFEAKKNSNVHDAYDNIAWPRQTAIVTKLSIIPFVIWFFCWKRCP